MEPDARRDWMQRLTSHAWVAPARGFYERHERWAPALFFGSGVGWDAATIYRIDSVIDNVLILVYLPVLALLIGAAALSDHDLLTNRWLLRVRHWIPAAIQFLMGALFSVFVFFYSQSASLTGTSTYLVLLIGLLIANEFVHERDFSVLVQLVLFFVTLASFLAYFIPMVTAEMSYRTFLAGSLLSAAVVGGLIEFLRRRKALLGGRLAIAVGLIVFFGGFLQLAYVNNWIPPVPLAVRDGGVFHRVTREGDDYRLRYERARWYAFWDDDDSAFRYAPGDTAFAFTAVFAPTRLQQRIFHEWQFFDPKTDAWIASDRIGYEIRGGRDLGYRGYTFKRLVRPGRWRVQVETADGRLLSRISFQVVDYDGTGRHWRQSTYR